MPFFIAWVIGLAFLVVLDADLVWLLALLPVALVGVRPRRRKGLDDLMAHPARAGWQWDRLNPKNWRRL